MDKNKHSPAYLRKRKMLLMLPVLFIPFITMAFWALGGGKTTDSGKTDQVLKGLNLQLPNANLRDEPQDKLSFYEKADRDSIKMAELMRNDPYYQQQKIDTDTVDELEQLSENLSAKHDQLITSPYARSKDPKIEQKVIDKIEDLKRNISQNEESKPYKPVNMPAKVPTNDQEFTDQVDRLQEMLGTINSSSQSDPEMDQVENALDKILDIQHPERVKERLKVQSLQNKQTVYAVTVQDKKSTVGMLDTVKKGDNSSASFFSSQQEQQQMESEPAIAAVIPEAQMLVSGAIVKLRLSDDIFINGILIPKDNLVFGVATLNSERLQIEINSIRYRQSLYPVKLAVFDLDGLAGIYIPGAISREVAKQSTDNSLQAIEMTSVDPSLKAQAAAAGIGAAKSLISKKVKLIRVMVKGGYRVLLKEQQ